jgi:hypothetical protein
MHYLRPVSPGVFTAWVLFVTVEVLFSDIIRKPPYAQSNIARISRLSLWRSLNKANLITTCAP